MNNTQQALYKVHFQDQFGSATITCDTCEEYNDTMENLRNDPYAEDIWCEYWDQEEGWTA